MSRVAKSEASKPRSAVREFSSHGLTESRTPWLREKESCPSIHGALAVKMVRMVWLEFLRLVLRLSHSSGSPILGGPTPP